MLPVLCVVGRTGSAVTEVTESLAHELAAKGSRVAVIVESKEPLKTRGLPAGADHYTQAGAEHVAVCSEDAVISWRRVEQQPSLDELVWDLRDEYDLVLAQGFRHSSSLKVEVHKAEENDELLCHKNELLAIAGDRPEGLDLPTFPLDDMSGLAELARRRFTTTEPGEDAALFIDGVRLPLHLFVRKMVAGTVLGMVRALKGVDEPKSVVITVRTRR